jgi:hypothetical protein
MNKSSEKFHEAKAARQQDFWSFARTSITRLVLPATRLFP